MCIAKMRHGITVYHIEVQPSFSMTIKQNVESTEFGRKAQ